jgi:hypothetical protein
MLTVVDFAEVETHVDSPVFARRKCGLNLTMGLCVQRLRGLLNVDIFFVSGIFLMHNGFILAAVD